MLDEEIVGLFWARDQRAIRETELVYGERLFLQADRILHCKEDAEESVNDTYLKAWDTIPPQRPRFFYAYLAKICRFFALGRLDWNQAKKRRAQIVELTEEMETCIPDRKYEQQLEAEEIGAILNRFLDMLSADDRLVFMCRYWYADSVKEIAHRCKMGESNVKIRLHRMRNRLKHFLSEEGVWI